MAHPSSDYFESLALTDPTWYTADKGVLSITTDLETSAGVPSSEQYDNWDSALQEGVYDYVFYAAFATHKYKMIFLDGDRETVLDTLYIDSGADIKATTKLPYLDDSTLALEQTNKFTGKWYTTTGRELKGMKANTD